MIASRKIKSIMAFLCLLYAVIAPAGASDRVLCVAADGHVSVESGQSGSCCADTTNSGAIPGDATLIGDGQHCGPCVDIPLVRAADQQRARGTQVSRAVYDCLYCFHAPIFIEHRSVAFRPDASVCFSPHDSVLAAVKTVTLLI